MYCSPLVRHSVCQSTYFDRRILRRHIYRGESAGLRPLVGPSKASNTLRGFTMDICCMHHPVLAFPHIPLAEGNQGHQD